MSFDYGCKEEDISRPVSNLKVWPTDGMRTALVDADAIPYIIGYTSNIQQYLSAKRAKVMQDTEVWADKIDHANWILNKWVTDAGCDSAKLYLTDGANNFRIKIAVTTPYKGQRIEDKPPFFYEIRDWLMAEHGGIMSDCCEADDEISIEAWRRHLLFDSELWTSWHRKFSDFVIVSGDKDLGIIPGWHCPPGKKKKWHEPLGSLDPEWREKEVVAYQYWPLFKGVPKDLSLCYSAHKYQGKMVIRDASFLETPRAKWELDHVWYFKGKTQDTYVRGANKGKGKFKRIKVGTKPTEYLHKLRGTGLKFFYSQLLTGDTVDNYKGLPGVGEVKAYEILDDAGSEQELVSRVRQLYFNQYGEAGDKMLLEQGQLAWMQTKKGELWILPSSNSQSFPA